MKPYSPDVWELIINFGPAMRGTKTPSGEGREIEKRLKKQGERPLSCSEIRCIFIFMLPLSHIFLSSMRISALCYLKINCIEN